MYSHPPPHPIKISPIFVSLDGAVRTSNLKPKHVQIKIYAGTEIEVTKEELPSVNSDIND